MTSNAINLRTGSVVRVHSNFGRGPIVTGTVIGVEWDESRQATVVDYKTWSDTFWAYVDQIVEVVTY